MLKFAFRTLLKISAKASVVVVVLENTLFAYCSLTLVRFVSRLTVAQKVVCCHRVYVRDQTVTKNSWFN